MARKGYPSDVSDDEWAFVAPNLTLVKAAAPQREHDLREVFNGLRWQVRSGAGWRRRPHDLPPGAGVYQQTQRWLKAGVLEAIVHDLRELLRTAQDRQPQPSAARFDSRTLPSSPDSGARAGDDGPKRQTGSQGPMAVDTLGQRLAGLVTPAHEQDRAQVEALAEPVQAATGQSVALAYGAQGYTGPAAEQAAATPGIHLEVMKRPDAKRGFVLLPRRWLVERSLAWARRFRRLARD